MGGPWKNMKQLILFTAALVAAIDLAVGNMLCLSENCNFRFRLIFNPCEWRRWFSYSRILRFDQRNWCLGSSAPIVWNDLSFELKNGDINTQCRQCLRAKAATAFSAS